MVHVFVSGFHYLKTSQYTECKWVVSVSGCIWSFVSSQQKVLPELVFRSPKIALDISDDFMGQEMCLLCGFMNEISLCLSLSLVLSVCTELHYAGSVAKPHAYVQGQSLLSAAHGQLHHALLCPPDLHRHALHERRVLHQIPLDH